MVERQQSGIYQATGPATRLTFGEMLETCRTVSQSQAELTWVEDDFLLAHNVTPWTDLPLWLPNHAENRGFAQLDCRRALSAGLRFRPLSETIHDTLLWDMARTADERRKVALSRKRELDLLSAWHAENTPAQS
jgi:2'-hydroxyisoflavone reductase